MSTPDADVDVAEDAVLHVRGLRKAFAGVLALDNVDLTVARGETHALLGANGSGKSTLIKVLSGYHLPEAGSVVEVGGKTLSFGSARASFDAGLRFIHQDLGLIESRSVAENLALGVRGASRLWVSERTEAAAARRVLDEFGIDADADQLVSTLRPATQTLLAIARALRKGLVTATCWCSTSRPRHSRQGRPRICSDFWRN